MILKHPDKHFSLGLDFGTSGVRCVVVDVADGTEVATAVSDYPSGDHGVLLDSRDPNVARQNPADYLQGALAVLKGAMEAADRKPGFDPARVVGIGVDATGSTPIPVDRHGTPLGVHEEFRRDLAAQAWLWKDHTAYAEAAEITERAARSRGRYLLKCGGTYSSEWFWSKILHCCRAHPRVFKAASSWVEQSDLIPAWLTGNTRPDTLPRNVCAAGHKAMYSEAWGGLPGRRFLSRLDPALADIRDRFATPALAADRPAGRLTEAIAAEVGLPPGLPVAVGAIDAHLGAVGAGIKPGILVKIIGTSTCDMLVVPRTAALPDIPGLCGIVDSSIVPGLIGLEAGQSAVGDIFNWFARELTPQTFTGRGDPHTNLTAAAARLRPGESGLLALDWNNGNRCVLVDPRLTGLLVGQTLHTNAAEVYRALIEATAFGSLMIINRLEDHGVKVREVFNCGGIAEKNDLVMQVYADVCNRPMKVSRSAETCALGAAVFGAVVGKAYRTTRQAQKQMTGLKPQIYRPDRRAARTYAELFALYQKLHDAFGTRKGGGPLAPVMKELIAIRDRVRKG